MVTFLESASGSGIANESVRLIINDDDAVEGNEEFYITLETRDAGIDLSLMNTTEVTIIDNDGMDCMDVAYGMRTV